MNSLIKWLAITLIIIVGASFPLAMYGVINVIGILSIVVVGYAIWGALVIYDMHKSFEKDSTHDN